MDPERPDYPGLTRLKESHSPLRRALWATLVYLVAGLIWITFSDRIVELWFPDPHELSLVQTWKGFLFVVVTGLVLFTVILRQLHKDRLLLSLQADQRRALRRRERQLTVLMDNLAGYGLPLPARRRLDHVVRIGRVCRSHGVST